MKKYLWVVIRTQKDRKLQTLIEVCTDLSSLMTPSQIHRPAEQTFAVHQEVESYPEDEGELWVTVPRGITEDLRNCPPQRHYNICLHWHVGWDTRCVLSPDRQTDGSRPNSGNRSFSDQNRGFHPQTCTGRDYSKIKCFSCGQFGHMRTRCPQPDASLPFRPAGWKLQSDNRQQRDGDNQQGNSP